MRTVIVRRGVLAFVLAGAIAAPNPLAGQNGASIWLVGAAVETAEPASPARLRLEQDYAAMRAYRPAYSFWQHIFTIPDGSVVYGSAEDGRLLAVFPASGDWSRRGQWQESWLEGLLRDHPLDTSPSGRRTQVATLLEPVVGEVLHNATRGNFLLPNVRRYGTFLDEWAEIYERFGVPGEIGLAQAILESGLNGRVRSEARALGFCQWLPQNWERMQRLAHHVIEGFNQTTQAPYCAAYLAVLATKYGSFIPALSEHHAGGTNVGRVVIAGGWMGGRDVRERYLLGSELARDLRQIQPGSYRDVYATYGPRSFRYAEMVFGNAQNVTRLRETVPQQSIHAMRTRRAIPLAEITRRTGLAPEEVRRYNPALVRSVPARANLYLPSHVADFGTDVAFWRRPAPASYAAVLDEFLRLEAGVDAWHDPSFRPTLRDFQRRFADTDTEEGRVMATVLAFVAEETYTGRRLEILAEYRNSSRILSLLENGVREREARRRFVTTP
jgi:hypothetical protein